MYYHIIKQVQDMFVPFVRKCIDEDKQCCGYQSNELMKSSGIRFGLTMITCLPSLINCVVALSSNCIQTRVLSCINHTMIRLHLTCSMRYQMNKTETEMC